MNTVERIREALSGGASSITAELRVNPRARLGLAAIAMVLLAAVGLRIADHATVRQSQIIALQARQSELTQLTSREHVQAWEIADAELQLELGHAQQQLWSDGPVGAAHANFYATIQELAANSELVAAQTRLGEARRIGTQGELTEIRVSIFVPQTAGATHEQVHNFLDNVASHPRLIYARSLRLRFQPSILFEGEFAAFVPSDAASDAATN